MSTGPDKTRAVWCTDCQRKIAEIEVGERYPAKQHRVCGKCRSRRHHTANPTSRGQRLAARRAAKMDPRDLEIEARARRNQQDWVRCPRWVITRLLAVAPKEIQDELAHEIAGMQVDPMPGDPDINVPWQYQQAPKDRHPWFGDRKP